MTDIDCCSLTTDELRTRRQEWERLLPALIGGDRTSTGVTLRFRADPSMAGILFELLEAERVCCPTISFTATVTLDIAAPPDDRDWVARAFLPGS